MEEEEMKKIVLFVNVLFILLLSSQLIFSYTITDNYWGADAHGRGDVIGDPALFDVSRMDVNFNNGTLTVDIYSRYFDNIGAYGTQLGDLFISNNGWNPYGTAPYPLDNASNGEKWEYALVLNDHLGASGSLNLYAIGSGTIVMSYGPLYSIYRNGQEVQFNPTGSSLATVTWAINGLGTSSDQDDYLGMIINYNNWGGGNTFGFHWAATCANDVIEGAAPDPPVPEPATMLLVGSGLIGLAGFARRKFKK
jgi:hypothetical protein